MVDKEPVQVLPMLPYDADGHAIELIWAGLGVATAWRTRRWGLARGGRRDGAGADSVRRLSGAELRSLLAVMEGRLRDVQQDIARIQAALAGLQAP